jgi:diaminopimelate epimerase
VGARADFGGLMRIQFTKMHGLGNDFVVIDAVSQHISLRPSQVSKLADRHTGVGFDQLLLIEPPSRPDADFNYRIFNSDGGEVEHCGNGSRCFPKFVTDRALTAEQHITVNTAKG